MKNLLSCLAKRFDIIVLIVFLVCLYAVLQIRLGCFWPIGESENAESVNSIIEGLSYSYIAAYVFYLLTVVTPTYRRKAKLKSVIKYKVGRIGSFIRDVLLEFSRNTQYSADVKDVAHTSLILQSKNWDVVVPILLQYNQVSITYFRYTNAKREQINDCITDLILCYKEVLSEDQLVALEEFRKSPFFKTVSSLSTIPTITVNSGVNDLVDKFVEMQKQYLKLEKMF